MKESTLKNAILKIPEFFFPKASFVILMSFVLMMPVSMVSLVLTTFHPQGIFITTLGAMAELLIALYLAHELLAGKLVDIKDIFRFQIWDLCFLALLLWSGISTLLAEDKELALMGTGYRVEGYTTYFIYASLYICGKLLPKGKATLKLLSAYGISISLLSLMTVVQANPGLQAALGFVGENFDTLEIQCMRYSSIFCQINHYGYVLTMAILCLAGLFLLTSDWKKYLYLLLFCFNIWALIINDTFGCYLASGIGLIFLSALFIIRNKQCTKPVILLFTLFIAVSITTSLANDGILFANFSLLGREIKPGNNLFQNGRAGTGRMALWKKAIQYIGEKPIFGHGPEGLYYKYLADGLGTDRPHNEYLQYAAFTGIPSLLFYVSALISMLVYCLKNLKKLSPELVVIGGIVFAYCVSAFFGNTMYYTSIYFFTFIGLLSACKE